MAYRLPKATLERALRHLCRYGDTDVFPHLHELTFFRESRPAVVEELSALDLDTYEPGGAIEALAPKSRYGFRIVHQLPAVENVLLLAAVVEIGQLIEAYRTSDTSFEAYSYRFNTGGGNSIFRNDRTYKDWLHHQQSVLKSSPKIKKVVSTDISDFYARINFHRLENLLDEAAPAHGAAKYIKKHIKSIRAKQSFGLPVGGSAARFLAELSLADTDRALRDEGIVATRFVDDFRIFLGAGDDPYDALGFLAEQLGINEGLSLNVAKTIVHSRKEFIDKIDGMTTDISDEAEGVALETITANLYLDDEPDEADVESLKSLNLLEFLTEEVNKPSFDMGRIKVIFRALKIVIPTESIEYISENFSELIVFAKELVLLMEAIEKTNTGCFNGLSMEVVDAILQPPASSVQLIRSWLLELFVRRIIPIDAAQLKRLEVLTSPPDRRQILWVRGQRGDKSYFRKQKTNIDTFSPFEQIALIWGASCLPKDEYSVWLGTIKAKFGRPCGHLFLKWAQGNQADLMSTLSTSVDDHPE